MTSSDNWMYAIRGKCGTPIICTATAYGKRIVVSAEAEHLTANLLRKKVERDYPDYAWTVTEEYGYLKATGVQC